MLFYRMLLTFIIFHPAPYFCPVYSSNNLIVARKSPPPFPLPIIKFPYSPLTQSSFPPTPLQPTYPPPCLIYTPPCLVSLPIVPYYCSYSQFITANKHVLYRCSACSVYMFRTFCRPYTYKVIEHLKGFNESWMERDSLSQFQQLFM